MTTHKNTTRVLAVLLAVLLFGQLAVFQIPAFAADIVPDVHDGAAYIPDDADVNDLLSQTLLSNYSDVGCQEWEYKATSTLSGSATKWVPVTGTTAGIIPALSMRNTNYPALDVLGMSYPALDSQSPAQDYAVRLKGTTEVYTFTKLAQPADADPDTAETPAEGHRRHAHADPRPAHRLVADHREQGSRGREHGHRVQNDCAQRSHSVYLQRLVPGRGSACAWRRCPSCR